MSGPVLIARTLATQLLHAAQTAPPGGVRGAVLADDKGRPARFARDGDPGGRLWAAFLGGAPGDAQPSGAEIDLALTRAPRVLVAALDVKGVLRLELHVREDGRTLSREVGIEER